MTTAVQQPLDTSALAACGREFYRRGWVLGTSGNFSSLISRDPFSMLITASGMEKGELEDMHFVHADTAGTVTSGDGLPSAETLLHVVIYNEVPNAGSILHTHSVWGTIVADRLFDEGGIAISGYEMLKGLAGVRTHEHTEFLPVIENSQDYTGLSQVIREEITKRPEIHGIYLRRHGLYTWGETIADARRHVEIFEFLFEVLGRQLN